MRAPWSELGALTAVGLVAILFVLAWLLGTKLIVKLLIRFTALAVVLLLVFVGMAGARVERRARDEDLERVHQDNVTLSVAAQSETERASGFESKVHQLEYELSEAKQTATVHEKSLQSKLDDMQRNAEQLASQVADIREVRDGLLLTLNSDILFDTGRSDLKCDQKEQLSRILPWLRFKKAVLPQSRLRLTGHTDNEGPDSINVPLSFNRAKAVADYLIMNGIPAEYIEEPIGKGRTQPKGFTDSQPREIVERQNSTPELRAANRRVEVLVVDPGR